MTKKKVQLKKVPLYPHSYLSGAIRKIWRWSPKRREIKKLQKACQFCGSKDDLAADHIIPVGPLPREWKGWDEYLKKMFDGELQMLCKNCHKEKTNNERKV